jgi:ATP synthase protein I
MSQPGSPTGSSPVADDSPSGDPWHAFGYLVSGVAFYGVLGWAADRWLGTSFLVAVGILVGTALGLYLTFKRFAPPAPASPDAAAGAAPQPTVRRDTEQD